MIQLRRVSKVFPDGHVALRDVTLDVATGCSVALLGPSGSGKTTTLKLINRLVTPTAGQVCVNGADVAHTDLILLRRQIGYVVQEAGLFPHLTARENAELVPRLFKWPEPKRRARTEELFALLGLDLVQHGPRYPAELSGGQRQRVGLARALAADPPILLMDEPFGALDPLTRRRLRLEFRALNATLHKTVVLVTHDVEEALLLADRIAVLAEGTVVQIGAPEEIRRKPASDFVASFLGLLREI
ncbi:MAG: ABC transporter ATP-binding protein [Candidatus Binatia bacterium]